MQSWGRAACVEGEPLARCGCSPITARDYRARAKWAAFALQGDSEAGKFGTDGTFPHPNVRPFGSRSRCQASR